MDWSFLGECLCFGIAVFMGEMALFGAIGIIIEKAKRAFAERK